jgi:hypothetical protein
LVKEVSEEASFFESKLPRRSFSLKQALLAHFKIWETTRNLHFPVKYIFCSILALKASTALLTAA